jgi:hypothetical protein
MAINPKSWLEAIRSLDRLLSMEASLRKVIEKQADEIQDLKDRVTKLEAREEIMVAEAKGAASAVASAVASQHLATIARDLGRLQGHVEATGKTLPPLK